MAIVIDRAGPEHAALLAALHRHILVPAPAERPWTTGEFTDLLRTPSCCALIVQTQGTGDAAQTPAGFAIATLAGGEGDLLFIGVAPEMRRAGMARALLEALLDRAREAGLERLLLEVAENNAPARTLYDRAGFRAIARRPAYYPAGGQPRQAGQTIDAIVMECRL